VAAVGGAKHEKPDQVKNEAAQAKRLPRSSKSRSRQMVYRKKGENEAAEEEVKAGEPEEGGAQGATNDKPQERRRGDRQQNRRYKSRPRGEEEDD
jgi:hypothetical protein